MLRDSQDAYILYGVRGMPANFYIGKLGKISKVEVGFHGESALENNIKDIL